MFPAENLNPLEQALAALRPRSSEIDRDRLLFLAGRASAEEANRTRPPRRWLWPASTALSSAAALVLLALLTLRPAGDGNRDIRRAELAGPPHESAAAANSPRDDRRAPVASDAGQNVSNEPAEPGARSVARSSRALPRVEFGEEAPYLRMRSYVLAHGVEALLAREPSGRLRESHPRNERPQTRQELLDNLLENGRPDREPHRAG